LAITLLEPIKDKKLLSKLKEYRGRWLSISWKDFLGLCFRVETLSCQRGFLFFGSFIMAPPSLIYIDPYQLFLLSLRLIFKNHDCS
jgi:hypothetical protein